MENESRSVNQSGNVKKRISAGGIIVNSLVALILIFVFIITLSMIISNMSGKGYTSLFGMGMFSVQSESMSPTGATADGTGGGVGKDYVVPEGKFEGFEKGDFIFVSEKNDDMTFEVGDIVSFYDEKAGQTIINTHRIIEVVKDASGKVTGVNTQGDNNRTPDNELGWTYSIDKIVGKYTGVKWVGFGAFIESPVGYWTIIGIPVFAILLYCIISFVLTIMKRRKKDEAGEKERIRLQILEELRASGQLQQATPSAPISPNEAVTPSVQPSATSAESVETEPQAIALDAPTDDVEVLPAKDAELQDVKDESVPNETDTDEAADNESESQAITIAAPEHESIDEISEAVKANSGLKETAPTKKTAAKKSASTKATGAKTSSKTSAKSGLIGVNKKTKK